MINQKISSYRLYLNMTYQCYVVISCVSCHSYW